MHALVILPNLKVGLHLVFKAILQISSFGSRLEEVVSDIVVCFFEILHVSRQSHDVCLHTG